MAKVIVNISMSLDGFVAGDDIGPGQPLGTHGLRLHDWIFARKTEADAGLMQDFLGRCGAVLVGCQTYLGAIHGPWENENPFALPAVVHCSRLPGRDDIVDDGFAFVAGDIGAAIAAARTLAGPRDVWVMGGARTVQRVLAAHLADELVIHLAPLLLGSGLRLFDGLGTGLRELRAVEAVQTPAATHLRYQLTGSAPQPAPTATG